jgi:hypothetical protein
MAVRKIVSREEMEKRDRKKKIIISIVLAVIMLFSTAGYAFFSNDGTITKVEKVTYKGTEFTKTDYGTWQFTKEGYTFETQFNAQEVENITVSINKDLDIYSGETLYFGINAKEDISTSGDNEIIRTMGAFAERIDFSCLYENCTEDKPIKDCSSNNVLIFIESNSSKVTENEKCIYLYYLPQEDAKAADAFLFNLLGL